MEQKVQVSFSTDSQGFISQECPSCKGRFKVQVKNGSHHAVSHCPYCGSGSDNGWLTKEQRAYALGVVSDKVVSPILDDFTRKLNRMNRPGSLVSFKGSHKRSPTPPKPVESEDSLSLFAFPCCGEPVKYEGSATELFCIVCGNEVKVS